MDLLRLVLLGLAALSLIAGGSALLRKAARPEPPSISLDRTAAGSGKAALPARENAAVRRAFEEKLAAAPEYAVFFDRLKAAFPSNYEAFIASLAEQRTASGEIADIDFLATLALRSLRASRGVLAAKAGSAALEHLFELQLAVVQALAAKHPHLCVDYLNGVENTGFLEFFAQNRTLIATMGAAVIDAIRDGELEHIERAAPSGADFFALEQALRAKGLSTPEIEALLDAKPSNPPVEDAEMCHAGEVYLKTLASLPQESRLRIYGLAIQIMARS